MNINEFEKYQIYQEEATKREVEENSKKEKQIKALSPEEREEIYQQYKSKNVVLVDFNNFKEPDGKSDKKYALISTGIFVILFFFVNMFLALIFAISYFVIYLYLGIRKIRIIYPTIFYDCPHCGNHHSNVIRTEEKEEALRNGLIEAACLKCKQNFNLLVKPDILDKFEKE